MAEFTPITSQEQLDAVLKDRLARAEKKYDGYISPADFSAKTGAYEKQIADLTAAASANAKKYANFEKDLADRDAKIKGYEVGALKSRIAHETGLSFDAIAYLHGETEDEIKSSAEGLKKLMGPKQEPDFNSEPAVKKDETRASMVQLAKNLGNK